MLRRAPILMLAMTPAWLAACSSDEPGAAATGGAGSGGQGASGGVASAGAGNASAGQSQAGGPSASGGSAGRSGGGRSSTGGGMATGGTSGSGAGGRAASTGGAMTSGGTGGTGGTAGRSASGGAPASGGNGANGPAGMGGDASSGGSASGGMASAAGAAGAATGARCPDATWKLSWGDDFEGASGSAVDSSKWAYDSGPNWYNGELQDYTTGNTNASLDGNGNLVIEARKEAREGREYTSARIKTEGKKTFTYGRFEGRMKMPVGQGMWPAFWMLGGNSWPNTGEIDIVENLGREPSIAYGTIHGPGYSGSAGPGASYTLPGAKFSDDFHVFAIEWEANAIRWYVDDTLYSTKTPADISGKTWVFDHGFFFILNLAVGGDWPGAPDGTTVFPQKLVVDYVHVCTK